MGVLVFKDTFFIARTGKRMIIHSAPKRTYNLNKETRTQIELLQAKFRYEHGFKMRPARLIQMAINKLLEDEFSLE
jgi:hypothetical protein